MNLLFDTHALLWPLDDDPALSSAARAAMADGSWRSCPTFGKCFRRSPQAD